MSNVKLFENKKVSSHYDSDKETWFFSIVDIVDTLSEQPTFD
jgi:DNA-damage-inducible protein D